MIKRWHQLLAYCAAWILALFATNPSGSLVTLAWMFPLGLFAFVYPPAAKQGGWGVLLTCFAVYIVHGFFYFRSRQKRSTILFLAILIVLLICNVSGCRRMID